nr:hypothetical protein K-LCC10_0103 [Kaumoebavirus]
MTTLLMKVRLNTSDLTELKEVPTLEVRHAFEFDNAILVSISIGINFLDHLTKLPCVMEVGRLQKIKAL